jgi:hypothetical protein
MCKFLIENGADVDEAAPDPTGPGERDMVEYADDTQRDLLSC